MATNESIIEAKNFISNMRFPYTILLATAPMKMETPITIASMLALGITILRV
jgi:hypothetical protein